MIWRMYKRRNIPVFRDFPEGCGVFSGHKSSAGESLTQSEFKIGTVRAIRDFPDFFNISNHRSETESLRIEGIDYDFEYSSDIATEESVLESDGENEVEQNQCLSSPCSTNASKTSPVMKRRLSFHDSNMEVESDVVDSSKRLIVSGLAATSKCPWRQPKKKHGSRKEKRSWIL